MLEKAHGLVLRFFTIIRMFSFKQNCIRLMGPDPRHVSRLGLDRPQVEHNDVQRAQKIGLRGAKPVHLVRCGACPIHNIALRTAPAGVNGFEPNKWVNNDFLWYQQVLRQKPPSFVSVNCTTQAVCSLFHAN
jgi:hypothetical protein